MLAAYRRAEYRVGAQWSLRIGQHCPALAAWQQRQAVDGSTFISAVNPRSRRLSERENRRRHRRLKAWLDEAGLRYLEGAGVDPDGDWPPEPGFLVAGLDRDSAIALGRQFDQNAVVWSGADAVPQLVLLR